MLTETSSLTVSLLFRNWAPFFPLRSDQGTPPPPPPPAPPPGLPLPLDVHFSCSGRASLHPQPALPSESWSPGKGTRTGPARERTRNYFFSDSRHLPPSTPPCSLGKGILCVPPPRLEGQKLPGPRLLPPSSPLQVRGLHVQPPRPQARTASGELSPGEGGRGSWGRGGGGPGAVAPPAMGRGKPAGPMRRGARRLRGCAASAAPVPPPAPPLPGLKPRGRLVAALLALSGARRCDRAPRRRHHAPPARAGPGRALPAGAARRRRRRLLRVSARRAPARLPSPPPAAARPTFPFRWPWPRRDLELRP